MVLHEPVHFVDPLGNFDTYEHGPEYIGLPASRADFPRELVIALIALLLRRFEVANFAIGYA